MKNFLRKNFICSPDVMNEMRSWYQKHCISERCFLRALSDLGLTQLPITVIKSNSIFRFSSNNIELDILLLDSPKTYIHRGPFSIIDEERNNFYSHFCVITPNQTQKTFYEFCFNGLAIKKVIKKEFAEITEYIRIPHNELNFVSNTAKITIRTTNTKNYLYMHNHSKLESSIETIMSYENMKDTLNIYRMVTKLLSFTPTYINISYGSTDLINACNGLVTFYKLSEKNKTYSLDNQNSWSYESPDFKISCKQGKDLVVNTTFRKIVEPNTNVKTLISEITSVIDQKLLIAFPPKK